MESGEWRIRGARMERRFTINPEFVICVIRIHDMYISVYHQGESCRGSLGIEPPVLLMTSQFTFGTEPWGIGGTLSSFCIRVTRHNANVVVIL